MATFLKLHHGFLDHEKHAELSNAALLLHISGLMYASERLTDGRLPKAPSVRLAWSARNVAEHDDIDALVAELVEAGVWENWPNHYQIVNYEKHNRTKAQVDERRASDRRRKQAQRDRGEGLKPPDADTDTEVRAESHAESQVESRRDNVTEFPQRNPWTQVRQGGTA